MSFAIKNIGTNNEELATYSDLTNQAIYIEVSR